VQVLRPDVFRAKIFRLSAWSSLLRSPTQIQSSTLDRNFFNLDRCRLPSRIRFFKARGRGDRWRRIFSRRLISAALSSRRRRSIASSSRSRASLRLSACERESCTVTLAPLGKCRKVTAVDTLFTFWPPGPLERAKISSNSESRMPSSSIRCSIERAIECVTPTMAERCFRDRSVGPAPSR
jgi:hypothetical protein